MAVVRLRLPRVDYRFKGTDDQLAARSGGTGNERDSFDGSVSATYTYEAHTSRWKTATDAKGQVLTYTYNRDNTVQSQTYANAAVPTSSVVYAYDAHYRRLLTVVDGTGR
jgi:hypothetical protein